MQFALGQKQRPPMPTFFSSQLRLPASLSSSFATLGFCSTFVINDAGFQLEVSMQKHMPQISRCDCSEAISTRIPDFQFDATRWTISIENGKLQSVSSSKLWHRLSLNPHILLCSYCSMQVIYLGKFLMIRNEKKVASNVV